MTHGDLTSAEREALDRLRANAPDAPEALARLDDASRARVLGALSDTGTSASESSDADASEAGDDEPVLESTPASQPTGPSTLADRLIAPSVSVAGKQVPLVLAAGAFVVLVVVLVLLVRACGGDGEPAKSLSEAAAEIAEEFDDDAFEVGELRIPANDVVYHAENLAQIADTEYDDLDDLERAVRAALILSDHIEEYVVAAATETFLSSGSRRGDEALEATRRAASVLDNSWYSAWADLSRRTIALEFEEQAWRYEDEDRDRYFEAFDAFTEATIEASRSKIAYHVARAERAVAGYQGGDARRDAVDALDDAEDDLSEAERELARAQDDVQHYYRQITWDH